MTTVELLYRYAQHPAENVLRALDSLREVYGIRSVHLDRSAKTVRVEYDATRLTAPTLHQLLRRTGLMVEEEVPLVTSLAPEPAPAAVAAAKA
ncbi:MAG: heavy-metal-associated domain-containing protein [Acidobacteriaceae bacterium]